MISIRDFRRARELLRKLEDLRATKTYLESPCGKEGVLLTVRSGLTPLLVSRDFLLPEVDAQISLYETHLRGIGIDPSEPEPESGNLPLSCGTLPTETR